MAGNAQLKVFKVNVLPGILVPNAIYYVRSGAGFRTVITDNAGAVVQEDSVTAAQLAGKQNASGELTAIAGIAAANNDIIQRKGGAWTNRTPAQLKADLALAKSDVGKRATVQKRSEYVIDLYNTFVNDKDMLDAYYKMEYSEFAYDDTFHGSDLERKLDKLLGHFSNIGRLFNLGILTREDLRFLEYEFLIINQNQDVQAYFNFLDNWFRIRNINDKKFEYFRLAGKYLEENNHKK